MLVGAALLVIYTVVLSSAFRPIHILDLMLTVLAFAGLVSYSFQRRVGWRPLWRAHAFVFPAWELVFNFVLTNNSVTSAFVTAVLMACFVPEYWALWRYAFHSPDIWNET